MDISAKHSERDRGSENIMETRRIERIALYAFFINLVLAGVKIFLAYVSGSLAVAAGAIDSAADSVASLTVFGGVKLSARKSARFPYGLYKIENIISIVVATFILFAGYEIIHRAFSPEMRPPVITPVLIIWLSVSLLVIFAFGRYALVVGRHTQSPTLIAEGLHRQVDVLSSAVVLISVLLSYLGFDFDFHGVTVDRVAALLVLVFIGYAAWELFSDGMRVLLDASLDHDTLEQVRGIIISNPLVTEIRRLSGRNAGRYRFIEVELAFRTRDLEKAHRASRDIESKIRRRMPHVERVLIHYEPRVHKRMKLAVPLADISGRVSAHFGEAPYFGLIALRLADGQIEEQEVIANPYRVLPKAKGIRVAEWLVEKKVDTVTVREDLKKRGPSYVFADAGVELVPVAFDTLKEVIGSFCGPSDQSSTITGSERPYRD